MVTSPSSSVRQARQELAACGAESEIPGLLASLRAADSAYVEWRRLSAGGLRHLQTAYVPLYERTKRIGCYQSHVVPGMLQTESYATALMKSFSAFHESPDDSAEAAAARVARSRVLHEPGHEVIVVLEEAVLTYRIGGRDVMTGQLRYLLDVMGAPGLRLGIIPAGTERTSVRTLEGFTVFDQAPVQVELLSARVVITRPQEARLYLRALTELAALAVYGTQARNLLIAALG